MWRLTGQSQIRVREGGMDSDQCCTPCVASGRARASKLSFRILQDCIQGSKTGCNETWTHSPSNADRETALREVPARVVGQVALGEFTCAIRNSGVRIWCNERKLRRAHQRGLGARECARARQAHGSVSVHSARCARASELLGY